MSLRRKSVAVGPESFVARWSRRKREPGGSSGRTDELEGTACGRALEPPAVANESPQGLTDADMPPIASLGSDSDYSGFLSPGVSEELRRLALRKLFHSPIFNVTDGLDDYDDDFTSFEILREAFHAKHHQVEDSSDAVSEGSGETVERDDSSGLDETNEVTQTTESESVIPSSSAEDEVEVGTDRTMQADAPSERDLPLDRTASGLGKTSSSDDRECDSDDEIRCG